jgi:hypothetical protein
MVGATDIESTAEPRAVAVRLRFWQSRFVAVGTRVFISHAAEDRKVAARICAGLEAAGIPCWIAPRDVGAGDFSERITDAIDSALVFVVLMSSSANASPHVKNEVALAGDKGIPMLPIRLAAIEPEKALGYYLRRWQWTDAFDVEQVESLLPTLVAELLSLVPTLTTAVPEAPSAKDRAWSWWSGGRSADAGVVSVLALAETVAAMSVYAFVAIRWGTLHLTVSACAAPLLLLRTRRSVDLGRSILVRIGAIPALLTRFLDRMPDPPGVLVPFLIPIVTVLMVVAIVAQGVAMLSVRVAATVICAVSAPIQTIRSVPRNWWGVVACVDSRQTPEFMPGFHSDDDGRNDDDKFLDVRLLVRPLVAVRELYDRSLGNLRGGRDWFGWFTLVVLMPFMGIGIGILALPALTFRWSLKGTALIWSPLIWSVRGAFRPNLIDRLGDVRDLAFYKLARLWSVVTLVLFAAKITFLSSMKNPALRCQRVLSAPLCDQVVIPSAIPPWQWASVANALLGWVIYLIADWTLHRLAHGRTVSELLVERVTRVAAILRSLLSLYTIASVLYLAAFLTHRWPLPVLGTRLLPW